MDAGRLRETIIAVFLRGAVVLKPGERLLRAFWCQRSGRGRHCPLVRSTCATDVCERQARPKRGQVAPMLNLAYVLESAQSSGGCLGTPHAPLLSVKPAKRPNVTRRWFVMPASLLVGGALAWSVLTFAPDRRATSAIDCMVLAEDRLVISENDREALCRGAPTAAGPVVCFEAADEVSALWDVQMIWLCQCAVDATPARCFEKGTNETDQPDYDIIAACRPITVRNLLPDCTPIGD